jgi:hypothetical protein
MCGCGGLLCLPVEQREAAAWSLLAAAPRLGTRHALQQAIATLQREAPKNVIASQYRSRVIELTRILNQSIGAEVIGNQDTSLNLETMDTPISNAQWLQARCAAIGTLQTEAQRLSAIDALVNSNSPGPRGFCTDMNCAFVLRRSSVDASSLLCNRSPPAMIFFMEWQMISWVQLTHHEHPALASDKALRVIRALTFVLQSRCGGTLRHPHRDCL